MKRLALLVLAPMTIVACQETPLQPMESPATAAHQGGPNLKARMVATGNQHACAVGVNLRTYCWGNNADGQLGDGSNTASQRPVEIAGGYRFERLTSGGWRHTCGLTPERAAYCWGWNAFGQLGDGTTTSSNVPVEVAGGMTFTSLDAGTYHTCGLTPSGDAYCWGANSPLEQGPGVGYALGAEAPTDCDNPAIVGDGNPYRGSPWPCSLEPIGVTGGTSFRSISAGLWASCGIATTGRAYCWGVNQLGILGTGTTDYATAPVMVAGDMEFDAVDTGAAHACGLVGSDAYCWGGRIGVAGVNTGQLGSGSAVGPSGYPGTLAPVPVVGGQSFSSLAASDANDIFGFTCGVTTAWDAYCWGSNRRGSLGTAAVVPDLCFGEPCINAPVPVAGGLRFRSLAAGAEFACGVAHNHDLYCWGTNGAGQLGDGTMTNQFAPVIVQAPEY